MSTQWDRCTKCVQSASFPKIKFDQEGVCNFCRKEAGAITQDRMIESAANKIADLLGNLERTGEYDALMCYSGGKDSTYTLKLAVEKYDLRVLSFTLDNGFISPVAFENIRRVVDHLGVDHLTLRPALRRFSAIVRASALKPIYSPKTLTRISSICNSCISIVNTMALKLAIEKRIPVILAGFTLGQIPANAVVYKNNYRFLQESRQESLDRLRREAGKFVDGYLCISDQVISAVESYPTTVNLLCIENVTETDIIKDVETIGWRRPHDVDGCSSNCMLNTFNNFVHERTFGYNPYELELSHLIRKGLMTREEALEKVHDQPQEQLHSVMKTLDIGENEMKDLPSLYE
jgi:hypothetical protein